MLGAPFSSLATHHRKKEIANLIQFIPSILLPLFRTSRGSRLARRRACGHSDVLTFSLGEFHCHGYGLIIFGHRHTPKGAVRRFVEPEGLVVAKQRRKLPQKSREYTFRRCHVLPPSKAQCIKYSRVGENGFCTRAGIIVASQKPLMVRLGVDENAKLAHNSQ